MKPTSRFLFLLVSAALIAAADPPTGRHDQPDQILIKMINLSTLSSGRMAKAATVARDIYAESGVRTEWIDCTAPDGRRAADTRCGGEISPSTIVLRLLHKKQSKRYGLPKAALGVAMVPGDGFGYLANAFSHRVAEIGNWTGADEATVLGHILAHEVGHLLLHQPGHSEDGLMQAAWRPKQLKGAASGSLTFTEEEHARLEERVEARFATR